MHLHKSRWIETQSIHSPAHPSINSPIHSPVHAHTHQSFIHSFIHTHTHPHPSIYLSINSSIHPCTHFPIHPPINSPIHPPIRLKSTGMGQLISSPASWQEWELPAGFPWGSDSSLAGTEVWWRWNSSPGCRRRTIWRAQYWTNKWLSSKEI